MTICLAKRCSFYSLCVCVCVCVSVSVLSSLLFFEGWMRNFIV